MVYKKLIISNDEAIMIFLISIKNIFIFLLLAVTLTSTAALALSDEILTVAAIEDADGYTQDDFNLDMLKAFEKQVVDLMTEKMKANLKNNGYQNTKFNVVANSVYVLIDGKKLAVIRLKHPPHQVNHVFVYGIIRNELRRVSCTREVGEQIPLSHGNCSKKIEEIYNIKFVKN